MRKPLLATKFYIPSPRPELVPRPRLIERLNHGLDGKLTLISAPAGFGKTILLSECARGCNKKVAWLSLDDGDNDPLRFLTYFITAIGRIENGIGEGLLDTLESTHPPDTDSILSRLVNEIADVSQSIILMLDDYHVITELEIQEILLFILENLPAQLHLVISSRSDPPWPLARFRVRGELSEIRSKDLRFSKEEIASFLNDFMGLALSLEDVAALDVRTEGWIAGLQMAAISMKGREDIAGFIQSFTGSHRFVMDYLMEEVLEQQTPEVRDFLLKTSILDRLTGPLCDSLAGKQNSQSVLLELEQKNLFLVPLDDQRRWYRYHHLFADLLKSHLRQTHPDEVLDLHKKASNWYETNGLLPDAISHALAANDIKRIVRLTEELVISPMNYGELRALMGWLDSLPETTIHLYPWLLVTRALGHLNSGKYELTEAKFTAVEKILSARSESDEMVIRIRGYIAAIRSYLAELREDTLTAIQQAEAALALLPEKDIKLRSYVLIRWANCNSWLGDFQKAIPAYKEAGEASKLIGDGQSAIIAFSEMALVQMIAGNLNQAIESIHDIQHYAEELALRSGRRLPAMGVLYRHLGHIQRERNELPEASYYANEAVEICRQWGEKEALIFGLLGVARVKFAQGEYDQVDDLFRQILPIADQISPRAVKQFQMWSLHFQLLRGKTETAEIWAYDLGLTPSDEFGYGQRFEYQNYAHLLAAQRNYDQALKIVSGLVNVAEEVGDWYYRIQYLVLQAIILHKMNRSTEAMVALEKALTMACAEGYVCSILDEGEAVGDLLRMAIAQGIEVEYAEMLLTALEDEKEPITSGGISKVKLAESLSQREMEVLRLLVTELTTPEIADELIVSVSTVRSHIKNIYSKLDAHSRFEAVTKARDFGIL
jgi:LuxR family maltose regulon positive regulatory protein